ncbi:MAG: hypothetical protein AVDCRST_MAG28-562, partial [uncultured Rubrobacteraceae bacterium]
EGAAPGDQPRPWGGYRAVPRGRVRGGRPLQRRAVHPPLVRESAVL